MAISINNSVQNISGTPGIITGVFASRPAATNLAAGTIYISTDTAQIFTVSTGGAWITVANNK